MGVFGASCGNRRSRFVTEAAYVVDAIDHGDEDDVRSHWVEPSCAHQANR